MDSSASGSMEGSDGCMTKVIHKNVGPEATLIGGKKSEDKSFKVNPETERQKRIEEYNSMRTGDELPELSGNDSVMNRFCQWPYSDEQRVEMHNAFDAGMTPEHILEFFYPDMPVVAMRKIILGFKNSGENEVRNK